VTIETAFWWHDLVDSQELGDSERESTRFSLKSPHGGIGDPLHGGKNQSGRGWDKHSGDGPF
jgi:hypothetical protein